VNITVPVIIRRSKLIHCSVVVPCPFFVSCFFCGTGYCLVFFVLCIGDGWRCTDCGESVSQYGYTALMYAAVRGHADCLRLLIDAGADKDTKSNVRRRSLLR
jgi:hypothetical protein